MGTPIDVPAILFIILGAGAIWYLLDYHYVPKQLPNEPPLLSHPIPYIGHIIGLLRHGTRYYELTSARSKLPIYTLKMLTGKVYIVTSPDLVSAVNRHSKALAFNPFIAQLGKRITGHDKATSHIVQHNLNGEQGPGYVTEVHDGLVASLAPGKDLERMTEAFLGEVSVILGGLESVKEIDLFAWTRQTVTISSTRAIYGPENPFNKNPNFVGAFWNFDRDLNLLMLNIAPRIVAPKGSRARSELGAAFQQYFENYVPGQTKSSAMILARYSANTKYGVTPWNQGRLEVGTLLGILANTIPSIFYMLVHIYSDPALLQEIRKELEDTSVSTIPGEAGRYINILSMRNKCSLLHSTFQELLRVHALGAGARFVREDVMLDNRYLLKKGMVIQMPTAVMHSDPSAWGADVREFRPRRFLKQQETAKEFKQNMTAYRPFGGGASLCPGRHFVAFETMALVAFMVLRFDLRPLDGQWIIPRQKQESLATNVFPPEKDIRVRVTKRQGFGDVDWKFAMA